MSVQINEPADPIAKGIIPTAKQAFGDLFRVCDTLVDMAQIPLTIHSGSKELK